MAETAITRALDIPSTIGSWFIGSVVSAGLLGITTLQCWIYYVRFPKDVIGLRFLVLVVWVLEFIQTACCVHSGYYYAVEQWGKPEVLLADPIWTMKITVPFSATIALIVHSFFAQKISAVTHGKQRIILYIIIILSLCDFGFSIGSFLTAIKDKTFKAIVLGLPCKIATAALGCGLIADWCITGTLIFIIRSNKSDKTRTIVQILIFYAANLGLLISLTDIAVMIMANITWSNFNLYQMTLFQVLGNLYNNSMLASLNSRTLIAEHLSQRHNLHFTSAGVPSFRVQARGATPEPFTASINIISLNQGDVDYPRTHSTYAHYHANSKQNEDRGDHAGDKQTKMHLGV